MQDKVRRDVKEGLWCMWRVDVRETSGGQGGH